MKFRLLFLLICFPAFLFPQPPDSLHTLYLIPGHGSDHRLFQYLEVPEGYRTQVLDFDRVPEEGESMETYAKWMASRVDTTLPYSFIGVSLGGMLAVEMSHILDPEHLILIASAKHRGELPLRYRFMRTLPLHRLFPDRWIKAGAVWIQPFFEPEVGGKAELCADMLRDKRPNMLRRGIHMIISWSRTENELEIYHLHGTEDTTLPVRNVRNAEIIEGATHMMVLFKPKEVNRRVIAYLEGAKS